jgi:hypothetical protein
LRIALDVDRAVYPRLFRIGLIPPLCDDGRDVRDLFTRRCEDLFADHLRDDGAHRLIRELIFTKDRLAFGKMFDDLYKKIVYRLAPQRRHRNDLREVVLFRIVFDER